MAIGGTHPKPGKGARGSGFGSRVGKVADGIACPHGNIPLTKLKQAAAGVDELPVPQRLQTIAKALFFIARKRDDFEQVFRSRHF